MTESLLLTDSERRRFSDWLKREAESDRMMLEQLKHIGPAGELMTKTFKDRITACLIIARLLDSTETMTLGGAK